MNVFLINICSFLWFCVTPRRSPFMSWRSNSPQLLGTCLISLHCQKCPSRRESPYTGSNSLPGAACTQWLANIGIKSPVPSPQFRTPKAIPALELLAGSAGFPSSQPYSCLFPLPLLILRTLPNKFHTCKSPTGCLLSNVHSLFHLWDFLTKY